MNTTPITASKAPVQISENRYWRNGACDSSEFFITTEAVINGDRVMNEPLKGPFSTIEEAKAAYTELTKAKYTINRYISEDDNEPDTFMLFRLAPGKDDIVGTALVGTFWNLADVLAERDRLTAEQQTEALQNAKATLARIVGEIEAAKADPGSATPTWLKSLPAELRSLADYLQSELGHAQE